MVIALQENDDRVATGDIRGLELIGLRYVGDRSSVATRGALASQGRWPGTAPLNRDTWYFALVPDEGLAYLESRDDLEVIYADDREAFAEALLSKPRLPENVFGRGANRQLQERVFDALDLDDPVEAGPITDQLHRLAGRDPDAAEAEDTAVAGRATDLRENYSRGELSEAVKAVREDTAEFNLRGAGVIEMSEFLAGKDEAAVNAALSDDGSDDE